MNEVFSRRDPYHGEVRSAWQKKFGDRTICHWLCWKGARCFICKEWSLVQLSLLRDRCTWEEQCTQPKSFFCFLQDLREILIQVSDDALEPEKRPVIPLDCPDFLKNLICTCWSRYCFQFPLMISVWGKFRNLAAVWSVAEFPFPAGFPRSVQASILFPDTFSHLNHL